MFYYAVLVTLTWDYLLTWQRMEKLQASFVVRLWPSKSLDTDFRISTWEESKEWLDNISEFSIAPLIMKTNDCWQRHAEEVKSNAVGMLQHKQSCLQAERTYEFIHLDTQLMFLIGRNLSPLGNNSVFCLTNVINWQLIQSSIHANNHWNIRKISLHSQTNILETGPSIAVILRFFDF